MRRGTGPGIAVIEGVADCRCTIRDPGSGEDIPHSHLTGARAHREPLRDYRVTHPCSHAAPVRYTCASLLRCTGNLTSVLPPSMAAGLCVYRVCVPHTHPMLAPAIERASYRSGMAPG